MKLLPVFFVGWFALLPVACGGGSEERPALTMHELQVLHERTVSHNREVSNFRAKGFFSYKDPKQDLNLSLVIRHDRQAGFTRISFHGNLDNDHWGEIVVHKNVARLYFPLQSKLYRGTPESSLARVASVSIRLRELLKLSEGGYYLIDSARPASGSYTAEFWILTLANERELQRLFYKRSDSRLSQVRMFEQDRQVARIDYGSYRTLGGREFATRGTLTVPDRNLSATVWFSEAAFDYRYASGDETFEVAAGVIEEPF